MRPSCLPSSSPSSGCTHLLQQSSALCQSGRSAERRRLPAPASARSEGQSPPGPLGSHWPSAPLHRSSARDTVKILEGGKVRCACTSRLLLLRAKTVHFAPNQTLALTAFARIHLVFEAPSSAIHGSKDDVSALTVGLRGTHGRQRLHVGPPQRWSDSPLASHARTTSENYSDALRLGEEDMGTVQLELEPASGGRRCRPTVVDVFEHKWWQARRPRGGSAGHKHTQVDTPYM